MDFIGFCNSLITVAICTKKKKVFVQYVEDAKKVLTFAGKYAIIYLYLNKGHRKKEKCKIHKKLKNGLHKTDYFGFQICYNKDTRERENE